MAAIGQCIEGEALILRDIGQMREQDVSPEELHQAKALLLRQIPLRESSEDAVAEGLLARADLGLPLDEPHLAAQRYYALSASRHQNGVREGDPSGDIRAGGARSGSTLMELVRRRQSRGFFRAVSFPAPA